MPKSNNKSNKIKAKIYLDYASSSLLGSSNPSAIHEFGVREKKKLESAREEIARVLGVQGEEIVFTSGSTESNNLAILGLVCNFKKPHIITSNIEHASVLETFIHLKKKGEAEVSIVPVNEKGILDPRDLRKALKKNTVLVSIMYANNEIGTIQPIIEITKEIRHFNKVNNTKIYFHTDATQAVNYLPIRITNLGVDILVFNGAKIYGPKGVGALYVKKGTPVRNIMFGGNQENGFRPGTENVEGASLLARALVNAEKIKKAETRRIIKLRDYFFRELSKIKNCEIVFNGDLNQRLPNNVNITIKNIPSDLLVLELSARGVMASSKSACKSGDGKASHVISAINKSIKDTDGSLRFSLGRATTLGDIKYTVKSLKEILNKLSKWYN